MKWVYKNTHIVYAKNLDKMGNMILAIWQKHADYVNLI